MNDNRKLVVAISILAVLAMLLLAGMPKAAARPAQAAAEPSPAPRQGLVLASNWREGQLEPRTHLHLAMGLTAPQARLLDRIIVCESGWKAAIENASSTASGYAQFLDSTWRTTRARMGEPDPGLEKKHEPYEHLRTFVWLWRADGTRHWLESKPCWRSAAI